MTVPFRLDSQGKDNLRYRRDMQRLGKIIAGLPSSPSAGASGDIQLSNGAGGFTAGPLISAIAPLTTKGDLYTYSTLATRLPVGTDGQILSSHSAATTGLQWSPAPTPTPSAGTAGQVQLSDGSGNFIVGTVPVTVNTTTGAISAVGGAFTVSSTGTPNVAQGQAYNYAGVPMITAIPSAFNYFVGTAGNFTMTGIFNIAMGFNALGVNTSGEFNSAIGTASLQSNTSGSFNIGVGVSTLQDCVTGSNNVGIGYAAAVDASSITDTVAIGYIAAAGPTLLNSVVSIGALSGTTVAATLTNLSFCTFIGNAASSAVDSAINSTAIGNGAQVTGNNQIVLGNGSVTQVLANGNLTTPVLNTTNAATAATGTFTGTMTGVQPFIGTAFKLVLIQLSGFTSAGGGVYTFPTAYTTAPTVADPLAGATITTTTTNVTVVGTSLSGAILLIGA